MCGIACILDSRGGTKTLRERAVAMARLLRHRGPDWSGIYADDYAVLAHERLSIVDVEHGAQPLSNEAEDLVLAVNGEIYNHRSLRMLFPDFPFKTDSDCEVIIPLYQRYQVDFLNLLSGIQYDCLRANKTMAAWGIEVRVPFLDREFLEVAMGFDPAAKMVGERKIEKYPLRKAFEGYLPAEALWRQKEQFSDGVGYRWIDSLKATAEERISSTQMENAKYRFPHNTPITKEAYLYRDIFESHFPGEAAAAVVPGGPSIACSTPTAIAWDASFAQNADPSGRAVLGVHQNAKESAGS